MSHKKVFSTGPMENKSLGVDVSGAVVVDVLNNDDEDAVQVHIKVFRLINNGVKVLIGEQQFTVPPLTLSSPGFDVSNTTQYEVQIEIRKETDDVLINVWGISAEGEIVAAHRVLHRELVRIDELTPGNLT